MSHKRKMTAHELRKLGLDMDTEAPTYGDEPTIKRIYVGIGPLSIEISAPMDYSLSVHTEEPFPDDPNEDTANV